MYLIIIIIIIIVVVSKIIKSCKVNRIKLIMNAIISNLICIK